jgi:hypothetical protein
MAECKGCIHDNVCNREVGYGYSVCPHYTTADVVPKSEVAELEIKLRQLEDKLRQYEQVCGKLAIKDGVAVGLIDGKETVYILKSISKVTKELAVRRTKAEVAREIFAEIEKYFCNNELKTGFLTYCNFFNLKKKYTEEQE